MDYARIDAEVRRNLRRTRSADPAWDAEDLVQAAWLRGLPLLADIPNDRERAHYLTRLAKNVAIDRWRWKRTRPTAPLYDDQPARNDLEDEALAAATLARLAPGVPPALLLHAAGYPFPEAARLTGQTLGAVTMATHYWRRKHAGLEA